MLRTLALLSLAVSLPVRADSVIVDLLAEYQRESGVPVSDLETESLTRLAEGDVVYRKVTVSTPSAGGDSTSMRVIGYRVIDQPRETLWLAALAYDAGYTSRLTEQLLDTNTTGGSDWYQHLDMPWPLKDRHWLIRTAKNTSLNTITSGRLWEHRWSLVPDARQRINALFDEGEIEQISRKQANKSVTLPLNNGAWMMAAINDSRTLVVVHATVDFGGIVPDGLVARQTRKNLVKMLGKIELDAPSAWSRYTYDYLIYRGDGTLIEPRIGTSANAHTTTSNGQQDSR